MIITAEKDRLAPEAEALAINLSKTDGKEVILKRFEGVAHGWDKMKDTPDGDSRVALATDEAYKLVVKFLLSLRH